MKMRTKIIGGIGVGLLLSLAVALAQVPSLFITTLTGTEQFDLRVPSSGTLVTTPQIVSITSANIAKYVAGLSNGVNNQTGTTYTFTGTAGASPDAGQLVVFNNGSPVAVTLPQSGTAGFANKVQWWVENIGAGAVTITPTTSTINGSATLVLNQGRGAFIVSDGTNYEAERGAAGLASNPTTIAEGGTGASTAATARTALGVNGITGGVAAAGGFLASPRNVWGCGVSYNGATSAFSAQTPVATEVYITEVFIPSNVTVTGVTMFNSGTISGNVKVGLANSSGVNVATSASTAQSGTTTIQLVPFTGTYAAVGPATYYIETFFDNNTTRPWAITLGSCGASKQTGQTFATGFTTVTPPTTFTTALGTVSALY
jgi:hypothetical protein